MMPDERPEPSRERIDALRLAGWIAGITLVLVIVLGLLAYADIWLF